MEEKRKNPRVNVLIGIVIYPRKSKPADAVIYNMSVGGLHVVSASDIPERDACALSVVGDTDAKKFTCLIKWKRKDAGDGLFHYGMEFAKPLDVDEQKLFMRQNKRPSL